MISTKLLSEVFIGTIYEEDEPFTEIKFDDEVNEVLFYTDCEYYNSINIYELVHLCKIWALKQGDRGYIIHSNISHTFGKARVEWYEKNHYDQHNQYRELTFYSEWFEAENNNEPETVFKACKWILEQKGNKAMTREQHLKKYDSEYLTPAHIIINDLHDDFQSYTCKNCKYSDDSTEGTIICRHPDDAMPFHLPLDFGCVPPYFERKKDGNDK